MGGAGFQNRLNRLIVKSRILADAGNYQRALGPNGRAVRLMEFVARQLPDGDLVNRSTLGDLYYERSDALQQTGRAAEAIEAITRALALYESVDPTHGDAEAVRRVIAAYRAENGDNGLEAFETHIGKAANARSYLAMLLAVHRRRDERDRVEYLGDSAIQTFTALVASGVAYERADLDLVRKQVERARAQLLR